MWGTEFVAIKLQAFRAGFQNWEKRLLVPSCLSVCPSDFLDVLMKHTRFLLDSFHEILYKSNFRKSVKKICQENSIFIKT